MVYRIQSGSITGIQANGLLCHHHLTSPTHPLPHHSCQFELSQLTAAVSTNLQRFAFAEWPAFDEYGLRELGGAGRGHRHRSGAVYSLLDRCLPVLRAAAQGQRVGRAEPLGGDEAGAQTQNGRECIHSILLFG